MELTVIEKTELETQEAIIERNMGAFYEIGNALAKIQDNRLYGATYDTFEEYCKGRWDLRKSHSYRFIEAAKVVDNLSPIGGSQPTNERQARPLTKLEKPEDQRDVWEKVVEDAPEGKVTAKLVTKVVKEKEKEIEMQAQAEEKSEETAGEVDEDGFAIIPEVKLEITDKEFLASYKSFLKNLRRIKRENWHNAPREMVIRAVNTISTVAATASR